MGVLSLGSGMSLSAISPETGYLGDANMGGDFGAELRYIGLSHLVIEGRNRKPTHSWIKDGLVEFRDADHFEGLSPVEEYYEFHKLDKEGKPIRKGVGRPRI